MASLVTVLDAPSSNPSSAPDETDQEDPISAPGKSSSSSTAPDDPSQSEAKPDHEHMSRASPILINLLKSIDSKLTPQEVHLKELALLQRIQKQLQSESTKTQFLWNSFLQIAGIAFAVIFGAFAIVAFKIGEQANVQSSQANQLALLSFCYGSNSSTVEGLCGDVFQLATQTLPPLVTLVMGPAPSLVANSTTSPSDSNSKSDYISIGIGILIFLATLIAVWLRWRERFAEDSTQAPPLEGVTGD